MIEAAFGELEPLVGTKGACRAVGRSRASHYRHRRGPRHGPPKPRPTPPNALSDQERRCVLDVLHSERFVDQAPAQVWAILLDEGTWLASESTMYRLLRADGEVRERRATASHPPRAVPELVAHGPNEVWSYDATALRGPARGIWYDLFMMLDLFSRYSPGWMVVEGQDGQVVRDWIAAVVASHGPLEPGRLCIHADRGPAMTSKPVSQLLADLRIGRTHGRAHVSNDNPYSEAGLKTLKYSPTFPGSLADARAFVGPLIETYNHEHRHSGIGYHTPASVHFGTAGLVREGRSRVLDAAYAAHPERFVNKPPVLPELPGPAWINSPRRWRDRASRDRVSHRA